jgi:hypothetical protein
MVALVAIMVIDVLVSARAPRYLLPQQKMEVAVDAGDGCILMLGDSRMEAAISLPTLHEGLRRGSVGFIFGPSRTIGRLSRHAAVA